MASHEPHRLRILLIDDDWLVREELAEELHSAGYRADPAATGKQAWERFNSARPDAILLGLQLPDVDGQQLLRGLRQGTSAPILAASRRHEESEVIACLDNGADDYVAKPLPIGELLARLRAALRRAFGVPRNDLFICGTLRLNFKSREVFVDDRSVRLTATEYDLLKALASHSGFVRTHHQLIREVWGATHYQDGVHLLRVTISNLRRKLAGRQPVFPQLTTEPGVGYCLSPDRSQAVSGQPGQTICPYDSVTFPGQVT